MLRLMARALMPLTSSDLACDLACDLSCAVSCAVCVAAASCTPIPVLTNCGDVDASACYSNADCKSSQHCTWNPQITNLDQVAITCCVPGPRGTGDAGATCTTMDQCGSGVCAYTPGGLVCSAPCTGEAGAPDMSCPAQIPWCVSVDPVDAGLVAADAGIDAGAFCGLAP
jgi:hypothetical protein